MLQRENLMMLKDKLNSQTQRMWLPGKYQRSDFNLTGIPLSAM
jgi:hypothetical protein